MMESAGRRTMSWSIRGFTVRLMNLETLASFVFTAASFFGISLIRKNKLNFHERLVY
jgi:hypothetical protein